MESLNRMAIELADEAIDFADELNVGVRDLANSATVLDFGVDHPGGLEAGLLLAELQTAGLATVQSRLGSVVDTPRPVVELATDHPALALLCSAKAGWELSLGSFEGLGAGPARALVAEETIFDRVGYSDVFDLTVLTLEATTLPDDAVADRVADRTGVSPDGVYLPTYPTASMAGSVSAAARAAELAVFRLVEAGYDPLAVQSASGAAPVPPVAADEETAIARTTDALAYGGRACVTVEEDPGETPDVASSAAEEFGTPLDDALGETDEDVAAIPAGVFGPAQVTIDVLGGPTYVDGTTHETVLAESFGL
ncbi:MAG: methenyltetrahydromethanopterin cyclohydrolase [Halobacteriaceae archaeon]